MDHALGALLGAAVGDAAGAFLEFWHGDIVEADVEKALTLPGGGCFAVGPGQFTDDTELALCQAYGLAGHAPSDGFPTESVATQYAWWFNASKPFDAGQTTSLAFRVPRCPGDRGFAATLRANVDNPTNASSKANGAAMRATPLAIWGHRLPLNALAACARQDAQLSHPNETTQDANACYVIACASLIAQPGDSEAALAAAEGWAGVHGCAEVQAWLAEARGGGMESYRASPLIGFVKHAFLLAFFHLRERSSFEAGLRHTLLCGGDTDTNAAIVCGLLGALHGAAAGIPEKMRSTVESYTPVNCGETNMGIERPSKLHGREIRPLVARLFKSATTAQVEKSQ
ncbi:hypothetical protein D9Q98_005032 [Chlorella vulgaris]|uniref:Uncharacterized protein n=1 Tax=Chlorella vulgaris TaxID=3077 RepID=A0A9D4YWQ7_CHLVU|nr:hypothetical protein D9Q98_005032 [Chlorella vulgaris]